MDADPQGNSRDSSLTECTGIYLLLKHHYFLIASF